MVFPMAERLFSREELENMQLLFDKADAELGQDRDRYVRFADEMALLHNDEPA